ncbi:MAG: hypothetical protein WC376_03835 [Candidatus Nanoarchaeia archaeon]|jgi:hypothetical protein
MKLNAVFNNQDAVPEQDLKGKKYEFAIINKVEPNLECGTCDIYLKTNNKAVYDSDKIHLEKESGMKLFESYFGKTEIRPNMALLENKIIIQVFDDSKGLVGLIPLK